VECNDVRHRHDGNNLSKYYLYDIPTELRTMWWTITVSWLACLELYYVLETLQWEWYCVISSGLSTSDFFFKGYLSHHSHFWKRCIFSEVLSFHIQCHIVMFVKASSVQIHCSPYTCNICKITICGAQLLWGISEFMNCIQISWY
jgi:hypothetical protein